MARFDSKYIQCNTPTNGAQEEEKENFDNELQAITSTIPRHDVLIIMDDINARVGAGNSGREDRMARNGIETMKENGELFAAFCELNSSVIEGTIFLHKDIHKYIWISPDRKTKNQIDHIAINRKWRTSLLDVKAYRGTDVGGDHMLVVSTIRLKPRRAVKPSQRKRLNIEMLKD